MNKLNLESAECRRLWFPLERNVESEVGVGLGAAGVVLDVLFSRRAHNFPARNFSNILHVNFGLIVVKVDVHSVRVVGPGSEFEGTSLILVRMLLERVYTEGGKVTWGHPQDFTGWVHYNIGVPAVVGGLREVSSIEQGNVGFPNDAAIQP